MQRKYIFFIKYSTTRNALHNVYMLIPFGFVLDHNDRGNQHEELSSNWQAGWNIINGQQGASLLGAPFAVGVGGFWSLIPLTLIALIGNYSSKVPFTSFQIFHNRVTYKAAIHC